MKQLILPLILRRLTLVFSLLLFTNLVFAQNPQSRMWSVPPYKISAATNTATPLPSTTNALGYNGQVSDNANNVMHDANGNLLFFIVDGSVYDHNGRLISDILNPNVYPNKVTGTTEYVIIPNPGNCFQYYLVAGGYDAPVINTSIGGVPHPYYTTLSTENDS
jgi:hypothetical protein